MIYAVAGATEFHIKGRKISIENSRRVRNHSEGFAYGYHGSGPAQLALAILLELTDQQTAEKYYQDFKKDVIARFNVNAEELRLPVEYVRGWLAGRESRDE